MNHIDWSGILDEVDVSTLVDLSMEELIDALSSAFINYAINREIQYGGVSQ